MTCWFGCAPPRLTRTTGTLCEATSRRAAHGRSGADQAEGPGRRGRRGRTGGGGRRERARAAARRRGARLLPGRLRRVRARGGRQGGAQAGEPDLRAGGGGPDGGG